MLFKKRKKTNYLSLKGEDIKVMVRLRAVSLSAQGQSRKTNKRASAKTARLFVFPDYLRAERETARSK